MEKYCKLLCGPTAQIFDRSELLPDDSGTCFLFVIKGGCASATPWARVADLALSIHAEVRNAAMIDGHAEPDRVLHVGKRDNVCYHSLGMNSPTCTCTSNFGGEGHKHKARWMSPDSNEYESTRKYAALLKDTLEKNYKAMSEAKLLKDGEKPVWLDLAYHSLFNTYSAQQYVDEHQDEHPNYRFWHPIASFNLGKYGGILSLTSKKKSFQGIRLLYQETGDVSVMGGDCQRLVKHGVPSLATWEDLLQNPNMTGLSIVDRKCIQRDLKNWKQLSNVAQSLHWLRINSALRWFAVHEPNCAFDGHSQLVPPAERRVDYQMCRLL